MELINTSGDITTGAPAPRTAEEIRYEKEQSISPSKAALRRFLRDRRAVVCLSLVLFMVLFSLIFPAFYIHMGPIVNGTPATGPAIGPEKYHAPSYNDLNVSDGAPTLFPLGPKSIEHPLGADTNGRDILMRLMGGIKTSITIALAVEVFDVGLGLLLGTLAGFYGGWLETVLSRFTDIMFAFPGLLLIILIGATLGPPFDTRFPRGVGRVLLIIIAIGVLAWPLMMRYVRGETLALKERQYVEAARTVGTSNTRIILRHIIPNLLNIVVVAATLNVLGTITAEAAISFLGVGLQEPNTSLGLMIADAEPSLYVALSELLVPALTLVALIVCLAFIGDGVRDAFDPRTKD
ncbi:MAG TPA: ABC transporter permease [Ktedonobacterales bacterium]|nr:ABC transporter permease [Ktedonobacterales bacterium]